MNSKITAVVPARNEESTVGCIVEQLLETNIFEEVIVVDNSSQDDTGIIAAAAGAKVVSCEQEGLGAAMLAGVEASHTSRIFRTDADIISWDMTRVTEIALASDDLTRGVFSSPYDSFPVTRLVTENACSLLLPDITLPRRVLSGTYAFRKALFPLSCYPQDWSFDIALVIHALRNKWSIRDIEIGELVDKQRDIEHYVPMARDILRYILKVSK